MGRNQEFSPRESVPEGWSPEEEWHGPYEVVKHPKTGNYHIVDNQNRAATYIDSPRVGRPTLDNANSARDHIDRSRSAKEQAKGIVDKIIKIGGWQDADHMQAQARNQRDESFALEYPGAKYSKAHDAMVLHVPGSGGWYGIHRGAYTDIHHATKARNVPVDTIPHYDGWPSASQVHRDVQEWIKDSGPDYAENVLPYHLDR